MISVQFDRPSANTALTLSNGLGSGAAVPTFDRLVEQSLGVLQAALNDPSLTVAERAAIAIEILKLSPSTGLNHPGASPPAPPVQTAGVSTPATASDALPPGSFTTILPPVFLSFQDFLTTQENQEILQIALKNEKDFVGSKTSTNAENYRESCILYATFFPEFYELLRRRILKLLPTVLKELNHRHFLVSQVEMQLTGHNDGCFYKVHNDSGSPDTATREITYVYYFFREPKAFSGGEFALYETDLSGSLVTREANQRVFDPQNNSIIFFDSRCKHEVLPVTCPSKRFQDSRFTLNGWLRRVE